MTISKSSFGGHLCKNPQAAIFCVLEWVEYETSKTVFQDYGSVTFQITNKISRNCIIHFDFFKSKIQVG